MAKLLFQLVTPERTVLSEDLDSLSCPTTLGEITILPNHAPLVATLVPGELITRKGTEATPLHVSGGFVQVNPHNSVVILADAAEHIYELDEERAKAAEARAREKLAQQQLTEEEYAVVAASLERSLSRLRVVRKHAHRRSRPVTSEGVFEE